jgi:lipopolysaccharide/colanic/teichoic acid biosynthesis glycosyltransferase
VNQQDAADPMYKIKADPRVTPVGRFIRKTSIDELPQLFNVLKGEMSLIGPRPPLPYEAENYQSWHLRRVLDIRPGITGLWQVEGRSKVSFDEMVRMDLRYVRGCSLSLDLRILAKTVLVVLNCKGAA